MIPSWAIGFAFIIVVVTAAQVVVRRLVGPANRGAWQNPTEPDVARLTTALDDVQRRLGELEERMDFAERRLAKERVAERLGPPYGGGWGERPGGSNPTTPPRAQKVCTATATALPGRSITHT